jgi:trans-aconitate methyltransferase
MSERSENNKPDPPVRPATDVFSEWAASDRDAGMEHHHTAAVDEMLAEASTAIGATRKWTAIDAGCGNGWIVRRLRAMPGCRAAVGVDGSAGMIEKARAIDPAGNYVLADLMTWQPGEPADLVVSMEVLYYLADPLALLTRIASTWLKPGGHAVFGIDHYKENEPSLDWPREVGVRMTTWSEAQWQAALDAASFTRVRTWRAAAAPGEAGTFAMHVAVLK